MFEVFECKTIRISAVKISEHNLGKTPEKQNSKTLPLVWKELFLLE